MEAAYAAARQKYPPPQYEVVLANAPNLEAFVKNYPKFGGAAPKGEGPKETPPPAKAPA
jgi:hypothetical protein